MQSSLLHLVNQGQLRIIWRIMLQRERDLPRSSRRALSHRLRRPRARSKCQRHRLTCKPRLSETFHQPKSWQHRFSQELCAGRDPFHKSLQTTRQLHFSAPRPDCHGNLIGYRHLTFYLPILPRSQPNRQLPTCWQSHRLPALCLFCQS